MAVLEIPPDGSHQPKVFDPSTFRFPARFPHLRDVLPIMNHSARGSRRFPESLGDRRFAYRNRCRFLMLRFRDSLSCHAPPVDTIRHYPSRRIRDHLGSHPTVQTGGSFEDDDPHSKMYSLVSAETAKYPVTTTCVTFSDRTILPSSNPIDKPPKPGGRSRSWVS